MKVIESSCELPGCSCGFGEALERCRWLALSSAIEMDEVMKLDEELSSSGLLLSLFVLACFGERYDQLVAKTELEHWVRVEVSFDERCP